MTADSKRGRGGTVEDENELHQINKPPPKSIRVAYQIIVTVICTYMPIDA